MFMYILLSELKIKSKKFILRISNCDLFGVCVPIFGFFLIASFQEIKLYISER